MKASTCLRYQRTVLSGSDQLLLHMGATGCIRPWRIVHNVLGHHAIDSPPSSWQSLLDQGLIQHARIHQNPAGWHYKQGRPRLLFELSSVGRQRYRELTGTEPRESELGWALSHHASLQHALAIRETRDHLLAMHIPVDDEPHPCPVQMGDPFGRRSEPDLVIYYQKRIFPVEVQREVRIHYLSTWFKSLELLHRLMLITFTLSRLDRQCRLLYQARQQEQLPPGPVLMSSLESFEQLDQHFLTL